MTSDIRIINAKIATESGLIRGGVNISNGLITKISSNTRLDKADYSINAHGKILIPGVIDVHVHLRDLTQTHKETFKTGTSAAAAGGVTSVIDMPNNIPPANNLNTLNEKIQACSRQAIVNVGFYSGLPEDINEITKIAKIGVFGFKIYLNNPPPHINVLDKRILRDIAVNVASNNSRLLFHAEILDSPNINLNSPKNTAESEINDFLEIHNPSAEIKAIHYILDSLRNVNVKIHFCHITLADSIKIIKRESNNNLTSIEVTPHHLLLDFESIYKLGGVAKTVPPLRNNIQVKSLWETAIELEQADVIASDHAPHAPVEKTGCFSKIPPGIPGLETTLTLMFTKVLEGRLQLYKLLKLLCYNPAEIAGLERRGRILEGYYADLVLLDCGKEYKINPECFVSQAKYSPFEGFSVKCKVDKTIVNGKIVYESDIGVFDEGSAVILKPIINEMVT
ncbi:MAG: dihydroorotase family protein [Candidatus Odinarchaeum yellowstonii]|uniref:Dihydroorotase family protein n=1 Tax=Odinarchaeota yellowstonii (strain LCB_4) TaxID=1841599 RepID=A0AAF0D303_ODILC|nr:MAG: dihydroorotase family protein [Candidatus Odinarchaeum yellowstonii]